MVIDKKKSQAFSADILVVAVVILVGVLFIVSYNINNAEDKNLEKASAEATEFSKNLVNSFRASSIIDSQNNVDVKTLSSLDSETIKNELGIRGEFAIVFEKDGKLVKIDSSNNINCIGSSSVSVNGVACK